MNYKHLEYYLISDKLKHSGTLIQHNSIVKHKSINVALWIDGFEVNA